MPQSTATITGEQREAIYEFVLEQMSRLTDLPLVIKREDLDTARRLAREFSQDLRLLEDLGWGTDDRREVALTMPPEELADAMRRLYVGCRHLNWPRCRRLNWPHLCPNRG